MSSVAVIVALPHMSGMQDTSGLVMLSQLVLLHDFSPRHVYPSIQVLYLLGGDALYLNLHIGQQLHKIRVRRQFTKKGGVNSPTFQQVNHLLKRRSARSAFG